MNTFTQPLSSNELDRGQARGQPLGEKKSPDTVIRKNVVLSQVKRMDRDQLSNLIGEDEQILNLVFNPKDRKYLINCLLYTSDAADE